MKKLFALMLAVAMLLTSTVALAEPITTYCIGLKDIKMTMDGETMLDLTGLNVVLGAGADENENNMALTATVYGGEDVALRAVAGVTEDGMLVAGLDGLSKAFTLNLAEILTEENIMAVYEQLMAQLTDSQRQGLDMIISAATKLSSEETLMNLLMNYMTYQSSIEQLLMPAMSAEEGVAYQFVLGEGEQTASAIEIIVTGEMMESMMKEAVKLYDSEPAIVELINGILLLGGETTQITSYAELLNDETINEMYGDGYFVLTIHASEDTSLMDIEIDLYEDINAEEPYFCGGALLSMSLSDTVDMAVVLMDEYGDQVVLTYNMTASTDFPGEVEHSIYAEAVSGEDTMPLLNGWIGPDAELGTVANFVMMPEDEYDAVGFGWSIGDSQIAFNMYDNYMKLKMGGTTAFDGAEAGEIKLFFEMEEYGSTIGFEAVMSGSVNEIDSADLAAMASGETIDILTITEDDINALSQEASFVLMGTLGVLGQNVPGLYSLMGF